MWREVVLRFGDNGKIQIVMVTNWERCNECRGIAKGSGDGKYGKVQVKMEKGQ